jgi:two-component system sensor histidine kinase TctE
MKKYQSLRKKLLVWLVPPLLILILLVSTILFRFAVVEQRNAFDNALYDSAYSIYQLINQPEAFAESFTLPKSQKQFILEDKNDTVFYSVTDANGKLLNGDNDPHLNRRVQMENGISFRFDEVQGLPVRVVSTLMSITQKGVETPIYIQVAETLHKREALAEQVLIDLIVPQLILVLFTVVIIWFGVERGLQPLFELQNAVSKRSYLDLSEIDLPNVPTEVMILVNSVNSLMRQLEGVLDAQNHFIADAAHQLRTPLAGAQAQLELALSEIDPKQHEQLLSKVNESLERLAHTISQLLSLARNQREAVQRLVLSPVNLNELAQDVTTSMVPAAIRKQIDLGFESSTDHAMIIGEDNRLKEMIYNLIDNALLYTPAGGKVTVSVKRETGEIVLSVEDNGPGIQKNEREKVFERFYRGIGTGAEGSGLGLAIVKEIAQLHQASVEIMEEPKQKGLNIQVSFTENRQSKRET